MGDCVLKRSPRNKREVLPHSGHCTNELVGTVGPTHLPPGERERLSTRSDGDRPFPHSRQRGDGDVVMIFEPQVLVGLIADDEQVMLHGHLGHRFEFVTGENDARGVVG